MLGLDAWHKCRVEGCERHVQFEHATCPDHSPIRGVHWPYYVTAATGETIYVSRSGEAEESPPRDAA